MHPNSILFSIKKKVKGGNTAGGSKTLPSSNSSPVHSVPPPPHTGNKSKSDVRKIITPTLNLTG